MTSSTPAFQPSCPLGGSWYACGNGAKFVGCCTTDPCNDSGCFQGNLRPASFLASAYGTFPDQQCNAGSWYTCSASSPPFMGCCTVDPCSSNGCPGASLQAGFLSNNPTQANAFDPQPPLSSTTSSISISTSTSTSLPSASSTSSANLSASTTTATSFSVSTLVGIIVGSVLGLLLILVAVFFLLRRRRRRRHRVAKHGQMAELPPSQSQFRGTWTSPPSDYNSSPDPYYSRDMKQQSVAYTSPYRVSAHAIPETTRPTIHPVQEADPREIVDPRTPLMSPSLSSPTLTAMSGRMSGIFNHTGSGVRSVPGNNENMRAELDGT